MFCCKIFHEGRSSSQPVEHRWCFQDCVGIFLHQLHLNITSLTIIVSSAINLKTKTKVTKAFWLSFVPSSDHIHVFLCSFHLVLKCPIHTVLISYCLYVKVEILLIMFITTVNQSLWLQLYLCIFCKWCLICQFTAIVTLFDLCLAIQFVTSVTFISLFHLFILFIVYW